RDAGQHQAALAKFMAIYAEPVLASKPFMLRTIVYNIANSHHHLAFAPGATAEEKQAQLDKAISWYQEYTARPGLESDEHADAVNALRLCRLGQPPQSFEEMEAEKYKMGTE
ncbi:MAG: hypothetical protein PVH65_05495, partial [Chloroflexota bacterium]